MYSQIIEGIRQIYNSKEGFIQLHEPKFVGNEKIYINDAIDSTFVSSVGKYVNKFESHIAEYTSSKYAIALVNGTSALHIALKLSGVENNDLVITQSLSFVATCNAIHYTGAEPAFVDIDLDTLGLSLDSLKSFLNQVEVINNKPIHIPTGKKIGACVPMHTFGIPCEIDEIVTLCEKYNIPVVEDAAESLGSMFKGKQTGTFGLFGTYSFNGNKTITAGGGGIIVTNDYELALKAKHLTTQAKKNHRWEYDHDEVGYNYRCPNINAALACAQLENLNSFIINKRETHSLYRKLFSESNLKLVEEPENCYSNYWLNSILLNNREERDQFLSSTNDAGVMTRPSWRLLSELDMYKHCFKVDLSNSKFIEERLVNIPSSVRL